jgi:lysophospholipase L1-like esterase
MKTIVCFGDSNTWGADPVSRTRLGPDQRWTGVLQAALGAGFKVVEEGLNGRTTCVDDPIHPYRNGRDYLYPCLETHAPFDLITIMLGTNDLKTRLNRSASDIAESADVLAQIVQKSAAGPGGSAPKVLLIAPPKLSKLTELAEMFEGGKEKSERFGYFFGLRAKRYGIPFLDASTVIHCSDLDGIHFEADQHAILGHKIAEMVREILAD